MGTVKFVPKENIELKESRTIVFHAEKAGPHWGLGHHTRRLYWYDYRMYISYVNSAKNIRLLSSVLCIKLLVTYRVATLIESLSFTTFLGLFILLRNYLQTLQHRFPS